MSLEHLLLDIQFPGFCTDQKALSWLLLYSQWPGAKQGLLIRGGDVLERLARIDYLALDKVIQDLLNYANGSLNS